MVHVVQSDGTYKLKLCMACCQAAFYDEWPCCPNEGDSIPLLSIPIGDRVTMGWSEATDAIDVDQPAANVACDGCDSVMVELYPATGWDHRHKE